MTTQIMMKGEGRGGGGGGDQMLITHPSIFTFAFLSNQKDISCYIHQQASHSMTEEILHYNVIESKLHPQQFSVRFELFFKKTKLCI
jgi:hypothetical protein